MLLIYFMLGNPIRIRKFKKWLGIRLGVNRSLYFVRKSSQTLLHKYCFHVDTQHSFIGLCLHVELVGLLVQCSDCNKYVVYIFTRQSNFIYLNTAGLIDNLLIKLN